ncbi:hypothetical protein PIB30_034146 [Stylosanthes scabra]|uniref:Uncharacterized protein n=1 Tax=Stylosanthes scabra TaxID=79078 RepID=A0ABU6VC35_9FABA|nr:hypothetical protein [Stylosanthes scabra]
MHAKKMSSTSSESEYVEPSYEYKFGSDDTFFDDESDTEETRSESLVQVARIRKRRNDSGSAPDEGSRETLPLAQKTVAKPRYPTQLVIDISSSSEDDPELTPITVLIPKTEGDIVSSPRDRLLTDALMRMSQEEQPPPQKEDNNPAQIEEHPPRLERQDEEVPSQSVVEVVPIYPTQEVIDISSSSEDEHEPKSIKVMVPKIEDCLVTFPSSKLITEVLMSMGQELQPETQPDHSVPSFSLGKEFQRPLRTQEQPPKTPEEEPPQLETPQPTQMIKNDLEERVANWAMVAKGDNDFEMIFNLRGHRFSRQ